MQVSIERPVCRGHRKVYSGECLELGAGPRWYWACEKCMETGSDALGQGFRPHTDPRAYWRIMRALNPNCWVPQAYL